MQGSTARSKKTAKAKNCPKAAFFVGMIVLDQTLLIFLLKIFMFHCCLDDRQVPALQAARMFRPERRQPALYQDGTGRHGNISIHSSSFLRWLVANL